MTAYVEDDKIITALRQTLQHISLQQKKFNNIDVELQQTKEELEKEKENHSHHYFELKSKVKHLQKELAHFKSLCEEQSTKISEMKISSAKKAQQFIQLQHELNSKTILMEEIKIQNETNALSLVEKLEDDHKVIENEKLKLEEINKELQQNITVKDNKMKLLEDEIESLQIKLQQMEQQRMMDNQDRIQILEQENKALKEQCNELKESENDTRMKYNDHCTRMSEMSKCSFNMLEQSRNLRRSISDAALNIIDFQQKIEMDMLHASEEIKKQSSKHNPLDIERVKSNMNKVNETKSVLNILRKEVEKELANFDQDIKSVQRVIFKQKSMMQQQMKQEQDKAAKLEETLSVQMENGQNMEQQLKDYLKQKDELQGKISKLEKFLKDKNEKDIITEMKRFRSAAIITSVTSLSEDGNKGISYHTLSKHERKAISLKSKLEKRQNSEIDINEKVDEFIRSGGLKRYPIMEQEFVYEPSETDHDRFRFGTKYISISYNLKHNELYVKLENDTPLLLQEWIHKNAANEMRKLLVKVSQKKKLHKQQITQIATPKRFIS